MGGQAAGVLVGSIDVVVDVVEGRADKVVGVVVCRVEQVADIVSGGKTRWWKDIV